MTKKLYIFLIFLPIITAVAAIDSHPRVLLDRRHVEKRVSLILENDLARADFNRFRNNARYSSDPVEFEANTTALHQLLNKIMKNSFLYMITRRAKELLDKNDPAADPERYMRLIEDDLLALLQPQHIRDIQNMHGLEGPGYAVKALAIAYDWGYDFFEKNENIQLDDIKAVLQQWGDWYTSPHRYYGSVFENHAPWGAKSLAYIAAALGDDDLFYGTATKIQASTIPDNDAVSIQANVNISAKGFFDQLMAAVNVVAGPHGGWHEGMSYFLGKQIPELLEYAEVICTYHNDDSFTNSVYSSPLFKNAGLFLYHMTTPDGMLQKIADTGFKTALPSGFYVPGGHTYGDINMVGAGYLGGYFLQRLYNRVLDTGAGEHAQLIKFYMDNYCFDFPNQAENIESRINYLYPLLWRDYSDTTRVSTEQVQDNPLMSTAIYFENSGIVISANKADADCPGIIRFDTQPYFYAGHQHFSAGHFSIFKGANLAIDGGRYISPQTAAARHYADTVYRSPLSHNVVLFGDELVGQKYFHRQSNRAPYTLQQLDAFQDYAVGPDHVSTFFSQDHPDTWHCPWHVNGTSLDVTELHDQLNMEQYTRHLLHLFLPHSDAPFNDFVITMDDISLKQPNSAHWQMHFRDNGKNTKQGDSVYVVVREEKINPQVVKPEFGVWYKGQLFVKSLSPPSSLSIADFAFPDSLCQECWNGRVWEESTHMLRFNSPSKRQHKFITILAPTCLDSVTHENITSFSNSVSAVDVGAAFFRSIKIASETAGPLYLHIAKTQQVPQQEHHIGNIEHGWMIFYGISPGEWQMRLFNGAGEILQSQKIKEHTLNSKHGVLVFFIDPKYEGQGDMTLSLTRR